MGRCIVGEFWNSFLNGEADGQFRIDDIDANGNFSGIHGREGMHDRIAGTCKDGFIFYTRAGSRRYIGLYFGGDEIRGLHSRDSQLTERSELVSDEWVGTHTTFSEKTE